MSHENQKNTAKKKLKTKHTPSLEESIKKKVERIQIQNNDKTKSLLDHIAYLLQGKGECTAVYYDNNNQQIVIAANTINSTTIDTNSLYKYINDTIKYIYFFITETKVSDEKMQTDFLDICKASLGSLQKEDPYKYLIDIEKLKLDKLIKNFFLEKGLARKLEKVLNSIKSKYSNNIANQISKCFYTINKIKHSLIQIKSMNNNNQNFELYNALKLGQINILRYDERELLLNINAFFTENESKSEELFGKDYVDLIRQQVAITQPSKVKLHLHAELKIIDFILLQNLDKQVNNFNDQFYIASSKLMCYDCLLINEAINCIFGDKLKVSASTGEINEDNLKPTIFGPNTGEIDEDNLKPTIFGASTGEIDADNLKPTILGARGTHGLEFKAWMLPAVSLKYENILDKYLDLRKNSKPNKKGMQLVDSSFSHEESYSDKHNDRLSLKDLALIGLTFLQQDDPMEIGIELSKIFKGYDLHRENALETWRKLTINPQISDLSKFLSQDLNEQHETD
jgi:hypothetical protein